MPKWMWLTYPFGKKVKLVEVLGVSKDAAGNEMAGVLDTRDEKGVELCYGEKWLTHA